MKITDLKYWIVEGDVWNWTFLKLYTDEGLTGVGEATVEYGAQTGAGSLEEAREFIIGRDPFHIESFQQDIHYRTFWQGPALYAVTSGIEQAMWDIIGKALNQPVYNLLGGPCRRRLRAYTHMGVRGGDDRPAHEQLAEQARGLVAEGWTALKWVPVPPVHLTMTAAEMRQTIENVGAVRDTVGPDVDLLIELHGRLNPTTAIQLAHELAPFKPMFFEEPIPPYNLDAMAYVRSHSPIPLATGERIFTKYGWRDALAKGVADIIQPDLGKCGGLLEMKKIAAMAEAEYVMVAPHNPLGPVGSVATLHCSATIPNFQIQEMVRETGNRGVPWRTDLIYGATVNQPQDGHIPLPPGPGLGIDLDEKVAAAHPYKRKPIRREFMRDPHFLYPGD
ncbi:MAG: galactonate dehydratase [Chloroflexi bacterium]|nr:galactonate dehydratase [Chloroflexota bacterium]